LQSRARRGRRRQGDETRCATRVCEGLEGLLEQAPTALAFSATIEMPGISPIARIDVRGQQQLVVGVMSIPEHDLPPHNNPESPHRTCHRFGDRPQRDAEHAGNVAIRQPGRPEMEAPPIAVGQRAKHGNHLALALVTDQRALRIVTSIRHVLRCFDDFGSSQSELLLPAVLQCQVVRDSKEPTSQAGPVFSREQVFVERYERVLHDVFSFADPQTERADVAEQRIPELVKESEHIRLNLGAIDCAPIEGNKRKVKGGLRSGRGHTQLSVSTDWFLTTAAL
jgi:hypothetical protein